MIASDLSQTGQINVLPNPLYLRFGSPVHPYQARVERSELIIDRNAGPTIKAGDADASHQAGIEVVQFLPSLSDAAS
jgi:hypothetical protein